MCLAVPGCVVSIAGEGDSRRGVVRFGGIERSVSLAFVPDAVVGEYVLVHVGFALSRIDEKDALLVFEYLREIDALSQELS